MSACRRPVPRFAWLAFGLVLSLIAGVTVGLPPAASAAAPEEPKESSVPVQAAVRSAARPSATDGAGVTSAGPAKLPSAASERVNTSGAMVRVGGLPVTVSALTGADDDVLSGNRARFGVTAGGPNAVQVATADAAVARAAGLRGVMLAVSRVADAKASAVKLTVGYSDWAGLFGANYGDRLRMVMLPECALTTPEAPKCQVQAPLDSVNAAGEVSAKVELREAGPSVMAVIASSSSPGATFAATSLSPSYSWSAGGQGGTFSWNYPLKVPASLGGPAPTLSLSYDSGSVDAQTLSQNGQTSWVGEGWDLQTGYVERAYRSCEQNGNNTGDLCWFSSYNATLVFGGGSYKLIRDTATGVWKTDKDDAMRVEQRFDAALANGDNDGEHWVVTTIDGTEYWFGKHKRYTGDPAVTDSVQTVPVFGNNTGEPCYNATFANAWCQQGYRWNLDYVVDRRGNSMTYFYSKFLGNYGLNMNTAVQPYVISSTLDHIDYGTRAGSEGATAAPMQMWFGKTNRCVGGCTTAEYPDTPWDLHCTAGTCPSLPSPAFWSPFKLSSVYTQVRNALGTGYRKVDQWDLTHTYPATGDNILPAGDDTSPALWLQTITHKGYAEDGVTSESEQPVTFGGTPMFNRVDWGNISGTAPYTHYRLSSIVNGVGGETAVAYSTSECVNGAIKPAPAFNPFRCFPVHHKPQQAPAGFGWFNKYVVTSVTERDLTSTPVGEEIWSYSYGVESSTDPALWAHDFSETALLAYRSWPLWRGYSDVTTTHGPATGTQTVSKSVMHRGMHGDSLATTDNQAMVWDARKASLITPVNAPGRTAAIGGTGGRCIGVVGNSTANNAALELQDCNGTTNQVWQYNLDTSGPRVFQFKQQASGRCLTVRGPSTASGTVLELFDCVDNAWNQVWRFAPDGNLVNTHSGKCIDLTGYGAGAGNGIQLWDCVNGWTNQVWRARADGSLFSPQSTRCIDVSGSGTADGTIIQSWYCNYGNAQQWTYSSTGSSLRNPNSNKCLDVNGTAEGALVRLMTCSGGTTQIWVPQANGTLSNPASGKCLDSGANVNPGLQLRISTCTGNERQRWGHQVTDHFVLHGKAMEEFTMEGSTVAGSTIHSYDVIQTGLRDKPVTGGQDLRAFRARETDAKTRTWIAATSSWRWTNLQTVYDSYGMPTDIKNFGDTTTTADDTCMRTEYNRNTTLHLIDMPKQSLTTDCTATPTDAGYVDGVHLYYDNATTDALPTKGLVTKTTVLASVTGGVQTWKQASRSAYDTYGRVTATFDAIDRQSTTTYSPAAGAPVTSTAQSGPMGATWTTNTTVDPGRGNVKTVTDINGKVATAHYDPLGRLIKVWSDNRATTLTPNRQYTYTLASPSHIHTQLLGPNGNQISSYQIFDGRMRNRQSQDVAPDGKRTISDLQYDSRGLPVKQTVLYNNVSGPTSTLVTFADTAAASQTRYVYDNRERKTREQLYKNDVFQWETETRYAGDRTGVIPPTGGTPTEDVFDALGRLSERRLYSGTPFTGAFDKSTYTYDRAGRLALAKDPANNQWTYTYDLRNRQTQTTDPDAGTTTTVYDDAGQVTSSTDSRSISLFYKYDLIGRPTELRQGSLTGTLRASWTYDSVAKGQPTSATRHDGGQAYTMTVGSYDDSYQPLTSTYSVPGFGPGGSTLLYPITNTYKVNGEQATMAVPAVGGLNAEVLTTTYTTQGLPQKLTSDVGGTLVDARTYTYDGELATITIGASTGNQIRVTNAYDTATRRTTSSKITTKPSGGSWNTTAVVEDAYTYDRSGNVTSIAGKANGTADQEECFRYDYLRRLREAWTQVSGSCTTPQRTGVDPYWRQWTFDTIGNRLTQTDKNSGGDTTWTSTISATKPHQVTAITASGANPTPTRSFGYDNAGNTTTATSASGTPQTLTWDAEGKLATLTQSGVTTSYLYDAAGTRLIANDGSKKTLYLPDGTELEVPTAGAPLGTRYYGVAVRDTTGLRWTVPNHQGSGVTQVDPATLAVSRQRLMPYGEQRTAQPAGWKGTEGFVGGTKDPTGYTHLGAREYDPTTGRFISVDPMMDLTDPQQWHAYSYAHNNPVTDSDPTGLIPLCGHDLGGCSGSPTGPDEESTSAHNPPPSNNNAAAAAAAAAAKAEAEARAAAERAERARQKLINAAKELLQIAMEELGITAALDCFTTGNLGSCVETGINVVSSFVGGLAGKLLAKYGAPWKWAQGAKLVKRVWNALENIVTGAVDWIKHSKLAQQLTAKANELVAVARRAAAACHSFAPGTLVLMADGTTKPINDVDIGDEVVATDPNTGETAAKEVTWLHLNQDWDLAEVTVRNDETGRTTVLETTWSHPFWNATDDRWTNAKDLTPGDRLRDDEGKETQQVVSVRTWTGLQRMHDLTVADIHTYYVVAADTPILVHNCSTTGKMAQWVQRHKGEGYTVYHGVDASGNVIYAGSTNNLARRKAEHKREGYGVVDLIPVATNLKQWQAFGAEQVLIEKVRASGAHRWKNGKPLGQNNVISPRRKEIYGAATSWARDVLGL